jgi:archaellum biogenesis ATPase FlaH
MAKRTLFLIRGLPGSGKSTLAKNLMSGVTSDGSECFIYEADDYFIKDGIYTFDQKMLHYAHQLCQENARNAAKNTSASVIISNTFSCRWEMEPYIQIASQFGMRLTVLDLFDSGLTNQELCNNNVHDVPVVSITRMRDRWEHNWRVEDPLPPWRRSI